jgi:FKBP-type peptidyl-prolyl cis-trans isomerase (trigger factor)
VANKENLNISDEELDQMLQDRATAAGYDTTSEYIGETSKEDYREYFLYDKVLDYLVENAQITNN